MKIDPNSPAFPTPLLEGSAPGRETGGDFGLPIRLHLAAMVFPELVKAHINQTIDDFSKHDAAREALSYADALIAEYNITEAKP